MLGGAGQVPTTRRKPTATDGRSSSDAVWSPSNCGTRASRPKMQQRAGYRHRRRSANCRYRPRRSQNRARAQGWLPPSLRHRGDTAAALVTRICHYAPVSEIHLAHLAFDTHSMSAGRTLRGTEYQDGSLVGTHARAYLRTKWGSACVYCGARRAP
nr:RRXRR domain-containing protein [Streptomyces sp. ATCC 21386]